MRQKKTAQITFRIDPNLKEAAGKAAALERRSLTSLIEKVLAKHLGPSDGTIGNSGHCALGQFRLTGDSMSQFERLLVPGCTESPTCQCGEEMDVATIEMLPEGSDAAVRIYRCSGCHREMRLTVWATLT